MKRLGDVAFDYLFLSEVNLGMCRGCRVCFEAGEDHCPIEDDRSSIAERIQRADGVILATPVYVGNVSGLTKNFIDRFAYTCHRPRFFKNVLAISTTGSAGSWFTLLLLTMSLVPMGFKVVHRLGVACGRGPERQTNEMSQRQLEAIQKKADTAARTFYEALRFDLPRPGVIGMAAFLIQKKAYLAALAESCDFAYWQNMGWLRKDVYYYYDSGASGVQKALAIGLSKLLTLAISR